MDTAPPLPELLPSPTVDVATAGALRRVAERGAAAVHDALDELRHGPLGRAGRTSHDVKGDGTPVTPADVEVDERLRARLADVVDDHAFVTEEIDAVAADVEWQWVLDPIDGTSNFAAGLPYWAVSVALCHGGIPVLGIVDAPDLGSRWAAIRGDECRRDGEVVHVLEDVGLADEATSHLPLYTSLGLLRRIRRPAGVRLNPRVMGAAALDGAMVAAGVGVAAAATGVKVWDVAASAVLVEAAGGASVALGDPVFPLVPGTDYTDVRAPSVLGPSQPFLEELVARLTPEGGSLLPS